MKESDIRPAELLREYLRLSASDAETFFPESDASSRTERPCPSCGGSRHRIAFHKNGFPLVVCSTCDTLYVTPAPREERLADYYRDSPSQRYWVSTFFPAVEDARRERIFRPRVRHVLDLLNEIGIEAKRVVDVGAGTGVFLQEMRNLGFRGQLTAVEANRDLAGLCAERGFETYFGMSTNAVRDPAWRDKADLAVAFEVFEHVVSPEAFLRELAQLVRPGGLIMFTGVSGDGFDLRVLGSLATAISPPHHLNFPGRRGMRALMDRLGLREVLFTTPGVLDVDIVRNAMRDDGAIVSDPFLHRLMTECDEDQRDAFQKFLTDNGLSSHMLVVVQRPE